MRAWAARLPVTFDTNIDPAMTARPSPMRWSTATSSGPIKSPQITVPFFASWPSLTSPTGFAGRLNPNYQQVSEIFSRANSTYEAAMLRVTRGTPRALPCAPATPTRMPMDWNPNESRRSAVPAFSTRLDFHEEYGTSNLDVRHSVFRSRDSASQGGTCTNRAGRIGNGWMLSGTSATSAAACLTLCGRPVRWPRNSIPAAPPS